MGKPPWLQKKIRLNDCVQMERLLNGLALRTVCQEALCPNIGECFARQTATFLILGAVCTRRCAFCGVVKGEVLPLDPDEPRRVAEAVVRLALRHVVVTSVTRDDLDDGGATGFVAVIRAIRAQSPLTTIEVLIPDFRGDPEAIAAVVNAHPEIIAHNLETVPRLYPAVRLGADYVRSLKVLRSLKQNRLSVRSKSGLMLGLGEHEQEVKQVMRDLREAQVELLTLGQYLAPSDAHVPVAAYILPEQFDAYRAFGTALGFAQVMSAPYVRSSYYADTLLRKPVVRKY